VTVAVHPPAPACLATVVVDDRVASGETSDVKTVLGETWFPVVELRGDVAVAEVELRAELDAGTTAEVEVAGPPPSALAGSDGFAAHSTCRPFVNPSSPSASSASGSLAGTVPTYELKLYTAVFSNHLQ
jgi:hypothetical protein